MRNTTIVPSKKTVLVYTDEDNAGSFEYKEKRCVSVLLDGIPFVSDVSEKEAASIIKTINEENLPVINNSGISLWA